jgi:hypothetical protein
LQLKKELLFLPIIWLITIILIVVVAIRSIGTSCLTHLKVSKLFGGEGPVGVNKLDFCLIKLL